MYVANCVHPGICLFYRGCLLVNSVMAAQLYNNCGGILFCTLDIYWLKMIPVLQTKRSNTVPGFHAEGGGALGSPTLTRPIITSCTLLLSDINLVNLMAALSTSVVTMSSLACTVTSLRYRGSEAETM